MPNPGRPRFDEKQRWEQDVKDHLIMAAEEIRQCSLRGTDTMLDSMNKINKALNVIGDVFEYLSRTPVRHEEILQEILQAYDHE